MAKNNVDELDQKEIQTQIAINKRKIDDGIEKLKEIRSWIEKERINLKEKYSKFFEE